MHFKFYMAHVSSTVLDSSPDQLPPLHLNVFKLGVECLRGFVKLKKFKKSEKDQCLANPSFSRISSDLTRPFTWA